MSHEEIKQRIKYLVEHGGLYDDPIEDVRQTAHRNRLIAAAILAVVLVDLGLDFIL